MTMLNPYVILGLVIAFLVSFAGGGLVGWHEKAIRVPELLEAQQTTDQKTCEAAQQLTKDANDALSKQNDAIATRLGALQLQHPTACVRVTRSTKLPASGTKHAGSDGTGVSSDWLRSYAAKAEQYRSNLLICTDFIAKERATK